MSDATKTRRNSEHGRRDARDPSTPSASRRATGPEGETSRDDEDTISVEQLDAESATEADSQE